MYISIPSSFLVSVYYAEDILTIGEIVKLQERISDSCFTNKFEKRKDLVIGVSLPNQRDERWIRDREAMEAYAKEKNVTLKIENAEYDVNKQISQVENLISQGIDVLILVAIDVAIQLANGETVLTDTAVFNGKMYVPTVLIKPVLVDRSNIDEVLIESGYFKREDVYGS